MAIPRKQTTRTQPEPTTETEAPKGKGKSFASLFKATKPSEGFKTIPDGPYQVLWVDGGYHRKEGANAESVYIDLVVVNDDNEGHICKKFYQIFNEQGEVAWGLGNLKADLELLGLEELEVESVEDLGEQLSQIGADDLWFQVELKTKKGYQNIYFQHLMEDQDEKPERPKV